MRFLIAPSGFTGMSAAGYSIAAGTETRRHYTRIYIGGRGIDGVHRRAHGAARWGVRAQRGQHRSGRSVR